MLQDHRNDQRAGQRRTTTASWLDEAPPRGRGRARGRRLDEQVAQALRSVSLPVLRVLLGVTFVWFGGLKVLDASPVEALVAQTLPFLDPAVILPVLGGAEIVLGAALVAGVLLRWVLPVLVAHLAGTFLTFLMAPDLVFTGSNPLLLTAEGEFVMKNLVLISAAVVLLTHAARPVQVHLPLPRRIS